LNASDGDFLEFILPPTDGAGTADLRKLVVTLTDLHDENISLTVVLQCPVNEGGADTWYYDYTYVQAGGQNQTPTGVEGNKVHVGNDWGAPTRFSFYGMHGQNVAVGNERMQLTYKQDSNMVVANGTKVVSLDNLRVFENAWKGFTTGEVKMTIQGGKYNRPYASMLITKIGVNNLSQVILEDDEAPEITVDYNGLNPKDMPKASKGLSYPVFNATAMDKGSGVLPVQTTVYYSYNSQQRYQLEVVDGRFKTARTGFYTIEYTATDYYGNVGKERVVIECTEDVTTISAAPQGEYATTAKTGVTITPAEIAYEGGVGNGGYLVADLYVNKVRTVRKDVRLYCYGRGKIKLDRGKIVTVRKGVASNIGYVFAKLYFLNAYKIVLKGKSVSDALLCFSCARNRRVVISASVFMHKLAGFSEAFF
jgi:hypothetical protein